MKLIKIFVQECIIYKTKDLWVSSSEKFLKARSVVAPVRKECDLFSELPGNWRCPNDLERTPVNWYFFKGIEMQWTRTPRADFDTHVLCNKLKWTRGAHPWPFKICKTEPWPNRHVFEYQTVNDNECVSPLMDNCFFFEGYCAGALSLYQLLIHLTPPPHPQMKEHGKCSFRSIGTHDGQNSNDVLQYWFCYWWRIYFICPAITLLPRTLRLDQVFFAIYIDVKWYIKMT